MSDCGLSANVGSMEGLGVGALAYARARVSLLGTQEHMDTLNRALDALDGLPGAALMGGWTFKGFTVWAQGLEAEIEMLKANIDSSPSSDEWHAKDSEINRLRGEIKITLAAERERCAKVCKTLALEADGDIGFRDGCHECADGIRGLTDPTQ